LPKRRIDTVHDMVANTVRADGGPWRPFANRFE
jgi:hypothetical protein